MPHILSEDHTAKDTPHSQDDSHGSFSLPNYSHLSKENRKKAHFASLYPQILRSSIDKGNGNE